MTHLAYSYFEILTTVIVGELDCDFSAPARSRYRGIPEFSKRPTLDEEYDKYDDSRNENESHDTTDNPSTGPGGAKNARQ